jgi:hypothetical protein
MGLLWGLAGRCAATNGSNAIHHGAKEVAYSRAEQQQHKRNNNRYQNKDHAILDQALPMLTR